MRGHVNAERAIEVLQSDIDAILKLKYVKVQNEVKDTRGFDKGYLTSVLISNVILE